MAVDSNGGGYNPAAIDPGLDLRVELPMSWSIWINLQASPGNDFRGAWYFGGANDGFLLLFHSTNGLRAYWRDAGSAWRSIETSLPDVGDWHHYVGTAATNDIEFFVDGSSVGTGSTLTDIVYLSANDFVYGCYADGTLDFIGAEFAIFEKVLTASEIALLGQRITRTPMKIPNLVAYWPLDDWAPGVSTLGLSGKDWSGNDHDLLAHNFGLGSVFNFTYPRRR